jgi:hypothetical protein
MITGEDVAVKLESVRAKHPQLEYESRVYRVLAGGGEVREILIVTISTTYHFFSYD